MNNPFTNFKEKYLPQIEDHVGFIIYSGNRSPEVLYKEPSLHDLQKYVGGSIELVHYVEDDNYEMVVDEEGLIHDKPFNLFGFLITERYFYGDIVILKKGVLI